MIESNIYDKTILIVDDSPSNIGVMNTLLASFNRKVATTGMKALELANGLNPPDLILLDIDMPVMNGFEVCEKLKSNPATKDIPVIFLTSNMDKKTTVEGFRLGACDFLNKPVNPEELLIRINTQLELADSREKLETLVQQMEMSSVLLKNSNEEMGRQKKALEEEKKRTDSLLLNLLPPSVALELKETGFVRPRHFPIVSVLFADLVGFTKIGKGLSPEELLHELNHLFVGIDTIIEQHGMEKIKTLGDGYMAAGGLPIQNGSNPIEAVLAGMEMIECVKHIKEENMKIGRPAWELRVGIHTGAVIAGVLGKNKFTYDIWGVTVNTASRIESAGEAGKVNISGVTYQLVKDKFKCVHREKIEVKNMGKIDMYFVENEILK